MAENTPPDDNSILLLNLTKVFKGLHPSDIADLVDIFELFEGKPIKNYQQLRKAMRDKKMLRDDGLKRFMNAVKGIGRNNLYEQFVNLSEDHMQVADREVHVKFNTLLVQFSKIICKAKNRNILPELKVIFHGLLPEIELKKAKCRDFMKLLKKAKIISWDNLNPLTEELKSILGKNRYHELFGDLVTEYSIISMANGKGEFATGSIKKDDKEEKSFEYNVTVTSDSEGKLTLTENVNTVSIDANPNANEMEDVINKSPASKKRCIPNNSLEGGNSNKVESYAMASKPHGNCVIFNNHFENIAGFPPRNGTEIDEERLVTLFKWLQFSVKTYNSCSAEEIKQKLLSVAEDKNNYNHDCLVVIVLSHGFEGGVHGNDGKELTFNSITEIFEECEALIGKPKLYFMQACQGKKDVVTVSRDVKIPAIPNLQPPKTNTRAPIKADQMMFTAAPRGHCSYRCGKYGSWFIQAFCTVVETHANSNSLMGLTTMITNLMSKKGGSVEDKLVTGLSCIRDSTLRKLFYFKPMGAFKEYKEKLTEENMSMVYE